MRRIIRICVVGILLLVNGGCCGVERFKSESNDKQNVYEAALKEKNTTQCGVIVWIPRAGERYHRNRSCGGMKHPREVTIEEAVDLGFTPCRNCC